jgi:hypothetical protein
MALVERALKSELRRADLIARFASPTPAGTPITGADRRTLACAGARLADVRDELLDSPDMAAPKAGEIGSTLRKLDEQLACLGALYGLAPPDIQVRSADLRRIWDTPSAASVRPDLSGPSLLPAASVPPAAPVPAGPPVPPARPVPTPPSESPAGGLPPAHEPNAGAGWFQTGAAHVFDDAKPADIHRSRRIFGDLIVVAGIAAAALVAALVAVGFGKNFGTLEDYLTVIVIGTAAQTLTGVLVPPVNQLLGDLAGGLVDSPAQPAAPASKPS